MNDTPRTDTVRHDPFVPHHNGPGSSLDSSVMRKAGDGDWVPAEEMQAMERELSAALKSAEAAKAYKRTLKDENKRLRVALQKVVTSWDDSDWLDENDFEQFRTILTKTKP